MEYLKYIIKVDKENIMWWYVWSTKQTFYYLILTLANNYFLIIIIIILYAGYGHAWSKLVGCMEFLRPVVSINYLCYCICFIGLVFYNKDR
jgi:hypothetical protein